MSPAAAVFLLIITPGPGVLSTAGVGAAWLAPACSISAGCAPEPISSGWLLGLAAVILPSRSCARCCCSPLRDIWYIWRCSRLAGPDRLHPHHGAGVPRRPDTAVHQPQGHAVNTALFSSFAFYPASFAVETAEARHYEYHLAAASSGLALCRGEGEQPDLPPRLQRAINLGMAACLLAVVILSVVRRGPAGGARMRRVW